MQNPEYLPMNYVQNESLFCITFFSSLNLRILFLSQTNVLVVLLVKRDWLFTRSSQSGSHLSDNHFFFIFLLAYFAADTAPYAIL